MKTFGQRVKEIRMENGLLLQDLAAMVGKTPAYISQIERPDSGTPPSEEVGLEIIKRLKVDVETKAELKELLYRTIESHKVARLFESSLLLEQLFQDTRLPVGEVANRMSELEGKPRSRQIVQVWKNGVQLPTHDAAIHICRVFASAGIKQDRLDEYRRRHLYDLVYSSKDIEHFTKRQKHLLAQCAVEIEAGWEPQFTPSKETLESNETNSDTDVVMIGGRRAYRRHLMK
jgi:transcriptional regulator with XRE-family HTH domain